MVSKISCSKDEKKLGYSFYGPTWSVRLKSSLSIDKLAFIDRLVDLSFN